MNDDMRSQIALFKFSLIAPLCNDTYDAPSQAAFCRQMAEKAYILPDGTSKRFTASTIKHWFLKYRSQGIDALYPKGRSDIGLSRVLSEEAAQRIIEIKQQFPHITGTLVYQKLIEEGSVKASEVSLPTVLRFIKNNHLKAQELEPEDRRAFELEYANDCWQADSSVGPVIKVNGKKKQTWLISFLDDKSRLVTHAEFFFNDNSVNMQMVLKKAIQKHGLPSRLYVDNGSSYRNNQLSLICASLGITLIHTPVNSPKNKGKIERLFRTLKDTWINGVDWNSFSDLASLNQEFITFVNENYNNHLHSVTDARPKERWLQDANRIKYLPPDTLDDCFLHRDVRTVAGDATVRICKVVFEVPAQYIKQKINVRFNPSELTEAYIFNEHNKLAHTVYPLRRVDNSKIKRQQALDYNLAARQIAVNPGLSVNGGGCVD